MMKQKTMPRLMLLAMPLSVLCLASFLLLIKAQSSEGPVALLTGDGEDGSAPAAPPAGGSPRLAALVHDVESGNREAQAAFWKEMQGKTPLVEPIPSDKRQCRVTFLWRGDDKTTRVTMLGGFPGTNFTKVLVRLKDTDLWYLTETYPTEARFGYFFYVNGPETLPWNMKELRRVIERHEPRRDPLNTRECGGSSYVELPDAPPQPWIKRHADVPHGQLTEQKFKSKILKAEYGLRVYVPPGSDKPGRRCWLMVAFDGGFPMMNVTLDNLLAAGKIPPVLVVGVNTLDGRTRDRDLNGSEAFAKFLTKELVPWARKTYQVHDSPDHTIVGGASLGGLMAAYCGLKHSDVFGKILAQSGTFLQPPGGTGQARPGTGKPRD